MHDSTTSLELEIEKRVNERIAGWAETFPNTRLLASCGMATIGPFSDDELLLVADFLKPLVQTLYPMGFCEIQLVTKTGRSRVMNMEFEPHELRFWGLA